MRDLAMAIAEQHCTWARRRRWKPHEVCASVGIRVGPKASWSEAKLALALAWVELSKRLEQLEYERRRAA